MHALTGTDPDRLREEKERGITIDLGFADLQIDDLSIGFIDVPGHERFVKNMLAGIGGIDAVLLVIAADESIMPQTREHFAICRLLGIRHGIVAITKCDTVDEELIELVELETQEFLDGSPLADAPIVRTSTIDGSGLDSLRDAISRCLEQTPERPAVGVLRLPIDRVFTVKGFGTVVTGTLLSGTAGVGDSVQIQPSGALVTIRGIQVHGAAADVANAGQRTALNLQGIQVAELGRGELVTHPGGLQASHMLDARVEVLPGFRSVEHLQRVRFHHGSAEILGRVATLEDKEIVGGASGYAQLRLESPYAAAPGDRFILRRYSPVVTLGGGVVIDAAPDKHRSGADIVARLARLEGGDDGARVVEWVRAAGIAGLDRQQLQRRFVRTSAVIHQLLATGSGDRGELTVLDGSIPRAIWRPMFEELETELVEQVGEYHRRYPLRDAAPKEELRARVAAEPPVDVLDAALGQLVADDRLRTGSDGYAFVDHIVRLPAQAAATRDAIVESFSNGGLSPPGLEQALAAAGGDVTERREILHHLLREGHLVRIKEDLVLHADALTRLRDELAARFARGDQFSVAEFKDWAGISRKFAIPLLEYLDSQRITRRVGDARERV